MDPANAWIKELKGKIEFVKRFKAYTKPVVELEGGVGASSQRERLNKVRDAEKEMLELETLHNETVTGNPGEGTSQRVVKMNTLVDRLAAFEVKLNVLGAPGDVATAEMMDMCARLDTNLGKARDALKQARKNHEKRRYTGANGDRRKLIAAQLMNVCDQYLEGMKYIVFEDIRNSVRGVLELRDVQRAVGVIISIDEVLVNLATGGDSPGAGAWLDLAKQRIATIYNAPGRLFVGNPRIVMHAANIPDAGADDAAAAAQPAARNAAAQPDARDRLYARLEDEEEDEDDEDDEEDEDDGAGVMPAPQPAPQPARRTRARGVGVGADGVPSLAFLRM